MSLDSLGHRGPSRRYGHDETIPLAEKDDALQAEAGEILSRATGNAADDQDDRGLPSAIPTRGSPPSIPEEKALLRDGSVPKGHARVNSTPDSISTAKPGDEAEERAAEAREAQELAELEARMDDIL